MVELEDVFETFCKLVKKNYASYVDAVNQKRNDGLVLSFPQVVLGESADSNTFLRLSFEKGEYTEKDRLIEACIMQVKAELTINGMANEKEKRIFRYFEALKNLVCDNSTAPPWQYATVTEEGKNFLRIRIEY